MTYWLNLFTGTTWSEFREAGASITGFTKRRQNTVGKIQPGDILICYMTGVMRWVGALEVLGPSADTSTIWNVAEFPARLEVKPLVLLDAEHGVPMKHLEGEVQFYAGPEDSGKFKGFVRGSPNRFKQDEDGALLMAKMREAEAHPTTRPVDARKLARKPLFKTERKVGKQKVAAFVSVPDSENVESEASAGIIPAREIEEKRRSHTEIQFHLLTLGAEMGLDVWVARNDRSRTWNGVMLGQVDRIAQELPTQFNEATQRTIELIDVLWLKGNSIVAAFEVESTTSVYSGLLRMSDLLALQPNLDIKLYIVAPDERRNKVEQEILRPTFKLREKPLPDICGFLAFSSLIEKVEGIRKLGLATSLSPDFLESTAEYFRDAE